MDITTDLLNVFVQRSIHRNHKSTCDFIKKGVNVVHVIDYCTTLQLNKDVYILPATITKYLMTLCNSQLYFTKLQNDFTSMNQLTLNQVLALLYFHRLISCEFLLLAKHMVLFQTLRS